MSLLKFHPGFTFIIELVKPSSAVTIVLRVVEDQWISKAVSWLLTQNQNYNDESIKNAVKTLCSFLGRLHFAPALNSWIMEILEGLRVGLERRARNCSFF
jgi:hypothetical protein